MHPTSDIQGLQRGPRFDPPQLQARHRRSHGHLQLLYVQVALVALVVQTIFSAHAPSAAAAATSARLIVGGAFQLDTEDGRIMADLFRFAVREAANGTAEALRAAGVALEPLVVDQGLNPNAAVSSAVALAAGGSVAVVGLRTSVAAQPMSYTLNGYEIPHITISASAAIFSSKTEFPFFARAIPSDALQGPALAEIVANVGWKRCAIVFTLDAYGQGIESSFSERAAALNLTVVARQSFDSKGQTSLAIDALRAKSVYVIVVAMLQADAAVLMTAASDGGMTGSSYAWLCSDSLAVDSSLSGKSAKVLAAMDGMVGIRPLNGSWTNEYATLMRKWKDLDSARPGGPRALPFYGLFTYDAVTAFSLALGRLGPAYILGAVSANATLGSGGFVKNPIGKALRDALYKVTFPGVTGNVVFTASGDRVAMTYEVVNIRGGKAKQWTAVATYVPGGGFQPAKLLSSDLRFFDGKADPPPDAIVCPAGKLLVFESGSELVGGSCKDCPVGTYSLPGDAACRPCEPGSFGFTAGAAMCEPCKPGTFTDQYGQIGCLDCPEGASCDGPSMPNALPGYFAIPWQPHRGFYLCNEPDACLGDADVAANISSGPLLVGGNISEPTHAGACAEGYTGFLCTDCVEGYGRSGTFGCKRCMEPPAAFTLLMLGCGLLFGMAIYMILVTVRSALVFKKKSPILMKILLSYLQVISFCRFSVPNARHVTRVFYVATTTVLSPFDSFIDLDCTFSRNGGSSNDSGFYTKLKIYLGAPALCILAGLVAFGLRYLWPLLKGMRARSARRKYQVQDQEEALSGAVVVPAAVRSSPVANWPSGSPQGGNGSLRSMPPVSPPGAGGSLRSMPPVSTRRPSQSGDNAYGDDGMAASRSIRGSRPGSRRGSGSRNADADGDADMTVGCARCSPKRAPPLGRQPSATGTGSEANNSGGESDGKGLPKGRFARDDAALAPRVPGPADSGFGAFLNASAAEAAPREAPWQLPPRAVEGPARKKHSQGPPVPGPAGYGFGAFLNASLEAPAPAEAGSPPPRTHLRARRGGSVGHEMPLPITSRSAADAQAAQGGRARHFSVAQEHERAEARYQRGLIAASMQAFSKAFAARQSPTQAGTRRPSQVSNHSNRRMSVVSNPSHRRMSRAMQHAAELAAQFYSPTPLDYFFCTLVITLFIVVPAITELVMLSFHCVDVGGRRFLWADMHVACDSDQFATNTMRLAFSSIFTHVILLSIVPFLALFYFRKEMYAPHIRTRFAFLVRGYRFQFIYFEAFVVTRKFLVLFLSVYFSETAPVQSLLALAVLLSMTMTTARIRPFEYPECNLLETLSATVTTITVVCGIFYKTVALDSKQSFNVGLFVLAINLAFLCVWAAFFLRDFAQRTQSLWVRARALVAARLRRGRGTEEEVPPPARAAGGGASSAYEGDGEPEGGDLEGQAALQGHARVHPEGPPGSAPGSPALAPLRPKQPSRLAALRDAPKSPTLVAMPPKEAPAGPAPASPPQEPHEAVVLIPLNITPPPLRTRTNQETRERSPPSVAQRSPRQEAPAVRALASSGSEVEMEYGEGGPALVHVLGPADVCVEAGTGSAPRSSTAGSSRVQSDASLLPPVPAPGRGGEEAEEWGRVAFPLPFLGGHAEGEFDGL